MLSASVGIWQLLAEFPMLRANWTQEGSIYALPQLPFSNEDKESSDRLGAKSFGENKPVIFQSQWELGHPVSAPESLV